MPDSDDMSEQAIQEFTVKRWRGGGSSGHYGSAGYSSEGRTFGGISIEDMLDRSLADGTKVRVTVEVIEDKPWPPPAKEVNPWHCSKHGQRPDHGHNFGHYAAFSTFELPGTPWGCVECHVTYGCCNGHEIIDMEASK